MQIQSKKRGPILNQPTKALEYEATTPLYGIIANCIMQILENQGDLQ